MKEIKRDSRIIGILFIFAIFTSIIGGVIIEGIIGEPNYLQNLKDDTTLLNIGVSLEIVNGIAVIFIASLLYKYVKKLNEKLAVCYMGLRIVEGVVCIFAATIALSYITLSQDLTSSNIISITVMSNTLSSIRGDIIGLLVPLFFTSSALILYYVLHITKMVPTYISIWGYIGALLILIMNILPIPTDYMMIFALPIIVNELYLGFWLIVKGLKINENKFLKI
jgi:hypothetical protein